MYFFMNNFNNIFLELLFYEDCNYESIQNLLFIEYFVWKYYIILELL